MNRPLIVRILRRIALARCPVRIISGRKVDDPYLSRYYLIGRPSEDEPGSRGWSLYLHHFHRSDDGEELHNHPWAWAASIILSGGYWETRRIATWLEKRWVGPGALNVLSSGDFHRIELEGDEFEGDEETWTLFLAGPRIKSWGWGFLTEGLKTFVPWRRWLGREPTEGIDA